MLLSLKSTAIAAAAALSVAAGAAAPAHAWGKKEQGFVAGVATAIIIDELIDNNRHRRTETYREPTRRPVYADPTPSYGYGSIYHTPAAQAFNSYSRHERKAIQRSLRAEGYYNGGIDGSFGPGTYRAITSYARAAGASGHLNTTGGAYALYDGLIF
ncbi:MAG: peptidoglycan-binding protein [Rhodobacter sp.]|jgi:hypothetical protein|nr:peptidoglycan-binding protein [Rhodobacter sp.]